jgi:hypothetical protein
VDRRQTEDALNAKIAKEEQASRWHKFQRDEGHIKDQRSRHPGIVTQLLLKILVIVLTVLLFGIALEFHIGKTFGVAKLLVFSP